MYVGANDGMLHAFDATTNNPGTSGKELFAYIPRGVYGNLLNLTNRYYAGDHQFYVDGSPSAGDVLYGGAWHTVLVGGESAGGNSIYAMDITQPGRLYLRGRLVLCSLWDFTDGNMGLTYSRPAIVNANWGALVLFGNGYNSPTEGRISMHSTPKPAPCWRRSTCALKVAGVCNNAVANGLSSVAVTNLNGDLLLECNPGLCGRSAG